MSRKPVEFSLDNLIDTISRVEEGEAGEKPTSRNQLYKKVGELTGLKASFVHYKINEHNIPLNTPKGERGRPKGSKNSEKVSPVTVPDVVPTKFDSGPDMSNSECLRPVFSNSEAGPEVESNTGETQDEPSKGNQTEVH